MGTQKVAKRKTKHTTLATLHARRWKPVRNGDIYCSPACGRGCTWAEYQAARKAAKELCAKLGPGWKPDVSENLGWHWHVTNGVLEVRQSWAWAKDKKNEVRRKPLYYAACQTSPQFFSNYYTDPAKCLRDLAKQLSRELKTLLTASAHLSDALFRIPRTKSPAARATRH